MIKKINNLCLSVFLCTLVASADPGLASRDLWFLPLGGEFQSTTQAEYLNQKENIPNSNSINSQVFTLSQGLKYSLYDDWTLGVLVDYQTLRSTVASVKTSTSGLTDPKLSVLYRITDQIYWPVFFDAALVLSPTFGRSQVNNVLRGSTKADFSLALGQELYDWSYKFTGFADWFSTEDHGNGTAAYSIKSRVDFGLNGALQFDFDPEWAAFLELGLKLPGKRQNVDSLAYKDPTFEFSAQLGPSYQVHRDLSFAFRLFLKHEKGVFRGKAALDKETDYTLDSYGTNLALNYNF